MRCSVSVNANYIWVPNKEELYTPVYCMSFPSSTENRPTSGDCCCLCMCSDRLLPCLHVFRLTSGGVRRWNIYSEILTLAPCALCVCVGGGGHSSLIHGPVCLWVVSGYGFQGLGERDMSQVRWVSHVTTVNWTCPRSVVPVNWPCWRQTSHCAWVPCQGCTQNLRKWQWPGGVSKCNAEVALQIKDHLSFATRGSTFKYKLTGPAVSQLGYIWQIVLQTTDRCHWQCQQFHKYDSIMLQQHNRHVTDTFNNAVSHLQIQLFQELI